MTRRDVANALDYVGVVLKGASPRPASSGAGRPIAAPPGSGWADADAFARAVSDGIPERTASGASQRQQMIDILTATRSQVVAARKSAAHPAAKATADEVLGEIDEILARFAVKNANNGGDIATRDVRATAAGDLRALDRRMTGKRKVKAKYVDGPQPGTLDADALEIERTRKALKKATDPLERDRLSQELTLASLRALHRSQPGPLDRVRGSAQKSDADELAGLERQMAALDTRLKKCSEPTTRAQIEQERREVAGAMILAKLREAHGRMEI